MLETTPVARPVIYTLAGCTSGERCVIERTEEGYNTHSDRTCVANDWLESAEGWEGRITADLVLHAACLVNGIGAIISPTSADRPARFCRGEFSSPSWMY